MTYRWKKKSVWLTCICVHDFEPKQYWSKMYICFQLQKLFDGEFIFLRKKWIHVVNMKQQTNMCHRNKLFSIHVHAIWFHIGVYRNTYIQTDVPIITKVKMSCYLFHSTFFYHLLTNIIDHLIVLNYRVNKTKKQQQKRHMFAENSHDYSVHTSTITVYIPRQ